MPISFVFSGNPLIGTAEDDFILAYQASAGTNANTINAGDGDDLVIGDSSNMLVPTQSMANHSILTALNMDPAGVWTTDENPMFGDASIPHATIVAEATIGQAEYFAVTIGAGQTITVDLDFGHLSPIGVPNDHIVELLDAGGNVLATDQGGGATEEGGLGSFNWITSPPTTLDPYLTFTVGAGGSYYIRVRPYDAATFSSNETFVLNVSVTGHAVGANSAMGNDTIDGGGGNDSLYGQGGSDTINGGLGDDIIHGGSGGDVLAGQEGADRLIGGTGADQASYLTSNAGVTVNLATGTGAGGHAAGDTLSEIEFVIGSAFADVLIGDALANDLKGDAGDDILEGGAGADILIGGEGSDTASYASSSTAVIISMGSGMRFGGDAEGDSFISIENLTGSAFNDLLIGDGSNNILNGGDGRDDLQGGGGDDTFIASNGNDYLDGGEGNDTLTFAHWGASVAGNLGAHTSVENLIGSAFNDILRGSDADNSLFGGDGEDVLYASPGGDILDGGLGVDLVSYVGSSSGVTVNLQTGVGAGGDAAGDVLIDIELLTGSDFSDILTGDAGENTLIGGGGDDALNGGDGDDTLGGGDGNDVLAGGVGFDLMAGGLGDDLIQGGAGGDYLYGEAGSDALHGGDDNDVVFGGTGDDVLSGGHGDDTLDGGDGLDRANFAGSAVGVNANLLTGVATGEGTDTLIQIENLTGSSFADVLVGDAGANTLSGGGGDDDLTGGLGDDILSGGAGTDTARYSTATSAVKVYLSTGTGGAWAAGDTFLSIENVIGSSFDDLLVGDAFANMLHGGGGADEIKGGLGDDQLLGAAGDDILEGGDGNDTLTGADNRDTLIGGSGADVLNGGTGVDKLFAGSGADQLIGGDGNDKLFGGSDNDVIEGGTGDDQLTGGSGDDQFVFRGASGADVILDFRAGAGLRDVISFTTAVFADFADVMANTVNDGSGNCVISKGGVSVTLVGVIRNQLAADDFVFMAATSTPEPMDKGGGPLTLPFAFDLSDPLVLPVGLDSKAVSEDAPVVCPPGEGAAASDRAIVDQVGLALSQREDIRDFAWIL